MARRAVSFALAALCFSAVAGFAVADKVWGLSWLLIGIAAAAATAAMVAAWRMTRT